MKLKYLVLFFPFVLAACGEKSETIGCSSDISTSGFIETLKKTAFEELSKETDNYGDVTNQIKRAALEEITFSTSDVITKSNDPNSTMKTCSAMVTVTVQPDTYQMLSDYSRTELNRNLDKMMDNLSLEQNANTFSARVDYTVQPTDDNKTVFVNIPRNAASTGAAFISALSVLKPIKEQQKLQHEQQQQAYAAEREKQLQEQALQEQQYQAEQLKLQQQQRQYDQQQIKMQQEQLQQQQQYQQQQYQAQQSQQAVMTLTQAKNDFLTADSDLNNRWQQLSSESRKALLLSQRQWIKNKDLICGKVTSQGTEAELAKIYACHAETIRSRIPELN
ncbi:lysozyme inhibitor LprI family protein [Morganella morganii]|uniref:DUF1311 domain-containing protein n=1 Tax=Morganella morganii TaxID=582 RepID=A0AAI9HUJ7_MORMO|nr:DUF1311 domain-containing protein [Morganella morganii]